MYPAYSVAANVLYSLASYGKKGSTSVLIVANEDTRVFADELALSIRQMRDDMLTFIHPIAEMSDIDVVVILNDAMPAITAPHAFMCVYNNITDPPIAHPDITEVRPLLDVEGRPLPGYTAIIVSPNFKVDYVSDRTTDISKFEDSYACNCMMGGGSISNGSKGLKYKMGVVVRVTNNGEMARVIDNAITCDRNVKFVAYYCPDVYKPDLENDKRMLVKKHNITLLKVDVIDAISSIDIMQHTVFGKVGVVACLSPAVVLVKEQLPALLKACCDTAEPMLYIGRIDKRCEHIAVLPRALLKYEDVIDGMYDINNLFETIRFYLERKKISYARIPYESVSFGHSTSAHFVII